MKTHNKASEYTLTMQQVRRLITASKTFRDRLIIESLYYCAMRRFEVANLRVENIDFDNGRIIVHGKGDYHDPIPVGSVFPDYLSNLKHFLGTRKKGFIFVGNKKYADNKYKQGKPLELSRINQIVAEIGKKAGINNPDPTKKHINPHILRHSLARHFKDLKFPLEFIQKYMRHSSLKTTMDAYGTLSLNQMENIGKKMTGQISVDDIRRLL